MSMIVVSRMMNQIFMMEKGFIFIVVDKVINLVDFVDIVGMLRRFYVKYCKLEVEEQFYVSVVCG